ncbi:MAG: hypothetical protein GAK43_02768 [Stenotrophomonas maltophilia]|nr:MAG: hypothetical protein GAK43_02768 [Stenotrophomonas maltophilia]
MKKRGSSGAGRSGAGCTLWVIETGTSDSAKASAIIIGRSGPSPGCSTRINWPQTSPRYDATMYAANTAPRWRASACSFSQLSMTMYWHIIPRPMSIRSTSQPAGQAVRPMPSTAATTMPPQAT